MVEEEGRIPAHARDRRCLTTAVPNPPLESWEIEGVLQGRGSTKVRVNACVPFESASSHPLWRVEALVGDEAVALLLKDLVLGHELMAARGTRPGFLVDPHREAAVYRSSLAATRLTAHAFDVSPPGSSMPWVLLELVDGVELWQSDDVEVWRQAARTLAQLHAGLDTMLRDHLSGRLVLHDRAFYERWAKRAMNFCDPACRPALQRVLARAHETVDLLLEEPRTIIHGESVASNILVRPPGDCLLIDWEMAGEGPGLWDLAALVSGWDNATAERIAAAYQAELWNLSPGVRGTADFGRSLRAARLQFCIQWLGWSRGWIPPIEHRQDWLNQALQLADELAL